MQVTKPNILEGVLVSIFGEKGPDPISWYPVNLDNMMLTEVSIKAVSILAGETGILPEHLSVLPLPKFHMTALIYAFDIVDVQARGGAVVATLSVLFNENYTPFVYKCIEELENKIKPMSDLAEPIKNQQDITEFIEDLFNQLKGYVETCQRDEITRYQIEAEVKKTYSQTFKFKVIVIGDPSVGKTTLLLRFVDKAFRELYIPTVGVQVSLKSVEYDDTLIKFNLWDIAGQESYRKVRNNFYMGSNAILIVYDINNPKTFRNVKNWYQDAIIALGEIIPGFLVGNKVDLPRQVDKYDGKSLADKIKLEFIETSAKTGENVDYIFQKLAEILIKNE